MACTYVSISACLFQLLLLTQGLQLFCKVVERQIVVSAGAWVMPVTKRDVVRIVKAGASDKAHKNALLALAGDKPGLWDGLDEEDVLGVQEQAVTQPGNGITNQSIKPTSHCMPSHKLAPPRALHVCVHQSIKHYVIVILVHTISNTTTLLAYTKGWSFDQLLCTCCFGHCLIACTCNAACYLLLPDT